MTIPRFAFSLGLIAFAACTTDSPPPCDDPPQLLPAIGSGGAVSGTLLTDAQDQRVVVSPDRRFLEYTFTRNGIVTTARYALSESAPPPALLYVMVRRPPPQAECSALAGRGPVIDAVEVKRGGVVIGSGRAFYSSARCGHELTAKADGDLNGPPDGVGTPLGDGDVGWTVGTRLALVSGDEVVVTVAGGAGEPFDVYASHQQVSYDVKLGTLSGTGSLLVP